MIKILLGLKFNSSAIDYKFFEISLLGLDLTSSDIVDIIQNFCWDFILIYQTSEDIHCCMLIMKILLGLNLTIQLLSIYIFLNFSLLGYIFIWILDCYDIWKKAKHSEYLIIFYRIQPSCWLFQELD